VTIKSIKHLKPEIATNVPTSISPCSSGQLSIEVTRLEVPGTGTLNPEKVNNYLWTLPSGWQMNGQTSNGSNEIQGGYYTTVSYPASSTSGTIKVRGYHSVSGCGDGIQFSKSTDELTVSRNVNWSLTSSKSYFLCGDADPITFTFTPSPALPCAVYYWNNSTTATTSNTFQITPGLSDVVVTVKAVYGNSETIKSLTVPVKSFDGTLPVITGPEVICDEEEYSISGLRPGYYVNWSCSRNLSIISETDSTAIFKVNGTGFGYVGGSVITPCGGIENLASQSVQVGPYTPSNFTVIDPTTNATPPDLNTHTLYWFRAGFYPSTDPADYHWEAQYEEEDGTVIKFLIPPGPTNYLEFSAYYAYPVKYTISLSYNNGCGFGNKYSRDYYFWDDGGSLLVDLSPNPASEEVTISLVRNLAKSNNLSSISVEHFFDNTVEWDLEIYNNQILKEKKTSLKGDKYQLNISSWKDGVYMVRVKYKDEILTGKLIVKR
jgi:hypothetical protein